MKKKLWIAIVATSILMAFNSEKRDRYISSKEVRYNLPKADAIHTVSKTVEEFEVLNTPAVDAEFIGFKEAIAFKESRGNYKKVNTFGYLGKYQFGESTLNRIRVHDTQSFLNDPKLQEEAFYTLCSLNKWILKRDIANSVGRTIQGIEITESGILAAAHLAGAGNVKKFLRSNGEHNATDAFGTDIKDYMKRFAGYDVSFVKPVKNARL